MVDSFEWRIGYNSTMGKLLSFPYREDALICAETVWWAAHRQFYHTDCAEGIIDAIKDFERKGDDFEKV